MYIEPQTNIKILRNCPLDTTFDHTLWFDNVSAQINYFSGLTKYNMINYSYQRVQRGVSRVGIKADNLYDCNYMMFQNTAYGNKWFYAFITSVEYVNDVSSNITFEIDVMQTWLFDCTPDYCFVEREHSESDQIGANIIPENLDTGEYVFNDYKDLTPVLQAMCIIVMICDNAEDPSGNMIEGIYSGCTLMAFNISDAGLNTLNNTLSNYNQKPDAIVGMYMCPVIATEQVIPDEGLILGRSFDVKSFNVSINSVTTNDTLNGYKPKNNKLYTYPYNFLSVGTGKNNAEFRYEFFDNLANAFECYVPVQMPIQVALRPKGYKGSGVGNTLNNETLILDDYSMCSWSTDSFKAWLAQNALPVGAGLTAGASALGLSTLGVSFPPLGVLAGVGTVMNMLSQGYKASIAADVTKGNINSGNIDIASKKKSFYGGRLSISYQYARIIDDYFTKFGYATKRVKVPNRSSRPHWNYVKTVSATMTGSVPSDDMKKICGIYDNGVTFWKHGNEVGRYDLDNSPT